MSDEKDPEPHEGEHEEIPLDQNTRPGEASVWSGLIVPKMLSQSLVPDLDAQMRRLTASITAPLREQLAEFAKASVPSFSYVVPVSPAVPEMFRMMTERWSKTLLGDLRKSLGPIFDPEVLRGYQRNFLPPNLRDHVDEVSARQVYDFLQAEGIPLYLVPRGTTAVRLLQAPDHATRRKLLSDRYDSLVDDCVTVLARAQHPSVRDEVVFTLDGVGAMRAGHTRSAQALFTVTLDSMIYRFYPDRDTRTQITNRKKGADVPDLIDSMGVHNAFLWLPIWNAHEEFWRHKGDKVPHHYSRHASVHGVSKRQFSKRNCVQALMLVTSLIGYADQLAQRRPDTNA